MKKAFAAVAILALAVVASLMISQGSIAHAANDPAAVAATPAAAPAPAVSATPSAQEREGREAHPHIRSAIRELNEAKRELQTAAHDFGGHRADALKSCDEAIHQLQLALQYDKK